MVTKKKKKPEIQTADNIGFLQQEPKKGYMLAKIYTPFKTFFEGNAKSISALNDTGYFDVLTGHHNFITMLKACDLKVLPDEGEEMVIPIARGLMHVRDDRVLVFLDV
jgi:F0F1-type ATP synthase epsilon subunit